MACNCGKKKTATQPKKMISRPPQTKQPQVNQGALKRRVIRRSAY